MRSLKETFVNILGLSLMLAFDFVILYHILIVESLILMLFDIRDWMFVSFELLSGFLSWHCGPQIIW